MNIGIVYMITAATSILQILLILNRTLATEYKETIEIPFCNMLRFFTVFCVIDVLWGMFVSKLFINSPVGFTVVSYGFHIGAALSAFIWFGYVIYYTKAAGTERKILNVLRTVLLAVQLLTIGSNLFTHNAFWVDSNGNYYTGSLRKFIYVLQFSYFIILLIYGAVKLFGNHKNLKLYRNAIIFSYIPLCFGIGQYIFYDASMYSLGFLISSLVIYSFNVTTQREEYLKATARKLDEAANNDALTGLKNRRAYERELERCGKEGFGSDFVYCSMDLNGLKTANDSVGHNAGDELIKGAAQTIEACFGKYGNIYRTGGDEFSAILSVSSQELLKAKNELEREIAAWHGQYTEELSISTGIVEKREYPDASLLELVKIADKRMYQSKADYYANRGIDRRGQQQALSIICNTYEKILKINLVTDSYIVIQMKNRRDYKYKEEREEKLSVLMRSLAEEGKVHPMDVEQYMEKTNPDYIRSCIQTSNDTYSFSYRRMIMEEFKEVLMEIIPVPDYGEENPVAFLYIKSIDR